MKSIDDSQSLPAYEKDYYGWLMTNARLIREGRFSDLDAQNLAEEPESMGRNEKRKVISRLAILMAHLPKWQHQPERPFSEHHDPKNPYKQNTILKHLTWPH
jgi:hypothetical protein